MTQKRLSKIQKAVQVRGLFFLRQHMPKGYTGLLNLIHATPLTKMNVPEPLNPLVGTRKSSPSVRWLAWHLSEHRRGFLPRNSGKWLVFLLLLHYFNNGLVWNADAHECNSTAEQVESGAECGDVWNEEEGKALKTSKFYKEKNR